MRTINLFSITSIEDNIAQQSYLKLMGTALKNSEIKALESFCNELRARKVRASAVNDFYLGFQIPQISKEFDLLHIGSTVINIELKSQYTDKVGYQLVRNRYYLKFLSKPVSLYTYCEKEKALYTIGENDNLVEVEFDSLISELANQKDTFNADLSKKFNPSDFLVSPFNSTDRFLSNEYFLTLQQEEITKRVLEELTKNSFSLISIKGSAGTGKSLLAYHIARELMIKSSVLIIHGGILNMGQKELIQRNWPIKPVKSLYPELTNVDAPKYKVIIVDEAQRLNKAQVGMVINYGRANNTICIFSHDGNQTLKNAEELENTADMVENNTRIKFELTDKIRTNKEVADFIQAILGRKKEQIKIGNNVNIIYFATCDEAANYIEGKVIDERWTHITHTPSIDKFKIPHVTDLFLRIPNYGTAHQVIGQEFDKVITVIDSSFYYDDKGLLRSYGLPNNPYSRRSMFFQAITRVRQQLEIVIANNLEVYNKMLTFFK